uniref:Uncharacterized protein n=1 Tax=Zea mays TaxID=4577 RepID=B6UDN8_MAIZE|nr:hypothetical protein [Zea mays]
MPSKRPSPHAMDEAVSASAAAARLRASTPRSKKRTSRSKSRGRSQDRRRSPNPNPSSRRERAADHGSAAPSRKSDRKQNRSFPDSATLATAMASVAAASAPSSEAMAWVSWSSACFSPGAWSRRRMVITDGRESTEGECGQRHCGGMVWHFDGRVVYFVSSRW